MLLLGLHAVLALERVARVVGKKIALMLYPLVPMGLHAPHCILLLLVALRTYSLRLEAHSMAW
jgi:hypothetical protein